MQRFPDSQPMMLEQLAMQRSLLVSPFLLADVGDQLDWFDHLRGVTRPVGVAGASGARRRARPDAGGADWAP
ncbi:hypothetical protein [Curtobacterium sp. CFBP9011]|uniref:hypothetical protein n=1 Tax=Curtobacterium sp. CFBP9011 TaxID=3096530 RepID=UPI002A6A5CD0|nr:hypothetical protein [Curtobacterium sp. CFBP9011]MDY1006328.1 hypothetical protein [Curtobacterium sp. CFBP9011]